MTLEPNRKSDFFSPPAHPVRTPGFEVENTSCLSPACRKRRLNGAVCRNHRIKKGGPVSVKDGHVKEPYEMSNGVWTLTVSTTSSVRLHCIRRWTTDLFPKVRYCPQLSRKRGDIKSHSSVSPSFNLCQNFCTIKGRALILGMCGLCYKTFAVIPCCDLDLIQGQTCCRAGDNNSLNLLAYRNSVVFNLFLVLIFSFGVLKMLLQTVGSGYFRILKLHMAWYPLLF